MNLLSHRVRLDLTELVFHLIMHFRLVAGSGDDAEVARIGMGDHWSFFDPPKQKRGAVGDFHVQNVIHLRLSQLQQRGSETSPVADSIIHPLPNQF